MAPYFCLAALIFSMVFCQLWYTFSGVPGQFLLKELCAALQFSYPSVTSE